MFVFPLATLCYGIDLSDYPADWPAIEGSQGKCVSFSGEFRFVGETLIKGRDVQGRIDITVFDTLFDERTEKVRVLYNVEEGFMTAHSQLRLSSDSRPVSPDMRMSEIKSVLCENGIPIIRYSYPWSSGDGTLTKAKMERYLFIAEDGSLIALDLSDVEVRHLFVFGKKEHIRSWSRFLPAEKGKLGSMGSDSIDLR